MRKQTELFPRLMRPREIKLLKIAGISFLLLCTTAQPIQANFYTSSATTSQQSNVERVKGKVVDNKGETIIGATIKVKGTTNGTITDYDGLFILDNIKKGDIIEASYIGYKKQQIKYVGSALNFVLEENAEALGEVVITALGIKREKKALGYSMQEVKGADLVAARETNLANALSGKVSGVQIIRSSNGPSGSSKIQLRGSNSITGLNQPLIVVDGVPVDNFTGSNNNDYWNPGTDMGNGLSDINSEDIASMSVLKGASAAALYGSRAGNGVILITTKKGKKSDGLGITISSSVSLETIFMTPDRQKTFGQGVNGSFDATKGSSWGPKIAGQSYTDWDGKTQDMRYFDNVGNYFNTGTNLNENISFSQQYDKTSIYTSLTQLNNASKIPGAKLSRTNLMLRASRTFGKEDRWSIDTKVQYIKSVTNNRPINGNNASNTFLTMYTTPTSLDITDFKNNRDSNLAMRWWEKGSGLNPYWAEKYKTNEDTRNRFLMNASLSYQFNNWLSASIKAGSDMYTTESENKLYAGSPLNKTGSYSISKKNFYENNFSFLITAQKDNLINNIGINASFGGNLMERKSSELRSNISKFTVPDLFWLSNGDHGNLSITPSRYHKKINSLYGTLGINYDGWAFLDGTFRNDWSSSLSKENRSFFYPSISASWIISDMIDKIGGEMPEWITYAKARISFAQVGNDLNPYELYNTYKTGSDGHTGGTTAESGKILYDESVRSELISSWEIGTELKFLNNRLGIDFTWYKSNARRQLLDIPMNALSGYVKRKVNAGNIQNQGIEIMLNALPIQTKDFKWSTQLNFSKNDNTIIELLSGEENKDMNYELGGYDNLKVYAVAGGNYGEIWGTKFLRVTDEQSPHYGALLLNDAGLPQATSKAEKIGDQQATFLAGWSNTLTYKNFSLSFLIDGSFGGDIFSATNQTLQAVGVAAVTAPGGTREEMVVNGVVSDGNNGYTSNTKAVTQQHYWAAAATSGNLGIGEANIYDASNIRLRNISINYSFPKSMLSKTSLQKVKLGLSCNNVWMISSNLNGVDPESVFATSTNATGFENAAAPTSRTFLFNITLGF